MIEYNHLSVLGRLYVGTRRVVPATGCLCVCGVGGVSVCERGVGVCEGVCVCVWRYMYNHTTEISQGMLY